MSRHHGETHHRLTDIPLIAPPPNPPRQAGAYLELQFVRANVGMGKPRPRVGIFRDRKTQEEEEEEGVWREMTQEDLAALSPEELKARKLQLGGQESEANPLEVRVGGAGVPYAIVYRTWPQGWLTPPPHPTRMVLPSCSIPPLSLNQVIEIRGGTVLFEPGAVGGSFNGVYFTSDQTDAEVRPLSRACIMPQRPSVCVPHHVLPTRFDPSHPRTHFPPPGPITNHLPSPRATQPQDVMIAIQQTLNLIGFRIWGGHVLMSGGTVTFNGCIFYDLELLTPFSDRIYFGGDVLVRAMFVCLFVCLCLPLLCVYACVHRTLATTHRFQHPSPPWTLPHP